jgi:glycerol dehydrogenase-like iron-containing ADH family enzyme
MQNYDKFDSDSSLIVLLMKGLIDSGLCMYYANGSIVASQGEHQISHGIEIKTKKKYIHGSLIALNTVFMLKLQKEILALENIIPIYKQLNCNDLSSFYGDELGKDFYKVYCNKLEKIQEVDFNWREIKCFIKDKLEDHEEFFNIFSKLHLPLSSSAINLEKNIYNVIVNTAFCMRDRFTFLDLMNFIL